MPNEQDEKQERGGRPDNDAPAEPQKKKSKWPLTLIIIVVSLLWLADGYLICRLFNGAGAKCEPCAKVAVNMPDLTAFPESAVSGQPLPDQERGTYYQDVLKFAIDFPKNWGPVNAREDYQSAPDGNFVIVGLSLSFDGLPGRPEFAYASYPDAEALMPGGGLGAEAVRISSVYDLRNWCDGKSACESFTNPQGVPFVRQDVSVSDGAGGQRTVRRYYMYNSVSGYRGVVFSAENTGASAGEMERVVNSVRVVE